MKKAVSIVLMLAMLLSCSVFITSCDINDTIKQLFKIMEYPNRGEVSDELKLEIVEDYLIWSGIQSDKTPEEIDCEFFGKYGDSVAVYFHTSGAYETPVRYFVAEVGFYYPDSRVIRIWNNGKFYTMPEAHKNGLISDIDVSAIRDAFKFFEFKEPYFIYQEKNSLMFEDFPPRDTSVIIPGKVNVRMDTGLSRRDKEWDPSFFGDIDINHIEHGIYDNLLNEQLLEIYLVEKTVEATIEAAYKLREIDGVVSLGFDSIGTWEAMPNDYVIPTDDEIGQWNLEHINVQKVWNFATEQNRCIASTLPINPKIAPQRHARILRQ